MHDLNVLLTSQENITSKLYFHIIFCFLINVIVVSYIFWYCIATNYAQSILKGTFWYIVPSDVYDKLQNACILLWVFFRGMQTCFNFPLLQFCISFWQINCWRSSHYCLLITHVSQYYTVRLNLIQKQVQCILCRQGWCWRQIFVWTNGRIWWLQIV